MKFFGLLFLTAVSTSSAFAPTGALIGKVSLTSTGLFATRAISPPTKKGVEPIKKVAIKKAGFSFGKGAAKPAATKAKAEPVKKIAATKAKAEPVKKVAATKAKVAPVKKAAFSFGGAAKKAAPATKAKAAPVKKAAFSFGGAAKKAAPVAAKPVSTKAKTSPVKKAAFSFGGAAKKSAPVVSKTAPKKSVVKKTAVKKSEPVTGPLVKIVSSPKIGGGYEVKMVKIAGNSLPSWYSN